MSERFRLENICFAGGGTRGLAYIGALRALNDYGICFAEQRPHLKRAGGTSFGALMAVLTAAGYNPSELRIEMLTTPLNSVVDMNVSCLITEFGLDSGQGIRDRVRQLLARKLGCADVTMREFTLLTGTQLIVTCTDLITNMPVYLSAHTDPELSVAKAVMMSMALPPMFSPSHHGGGLLVDGGLQDNFPMTQFPADGSTLGLRVAWGTGFDTSSFAQYIGRVTYCAMEMNERVQWEALPIQMRQQTITIDVGDIGTLDFNLSTAEQHAILQAGFNTACAALLLMCVRRTFHQPNSTHSLQLQAGAGALEQRQQHAVAMADSVGCRRDAV